MTIEAVLTVVDEILPPSVVDCLDCFAELVTKNTLFAEAVRGEPFTESEGSDNPGPRPRMRKLLATLGAPQTGEAMVEMCANMATRFDMYRLRLVFKIINQLAPMKYMRQAAADAGQLEQCPWIPEFIARHSKFHVAGLCAAIRSDNCKSSTEVAEVAKASKLSRNEFVRRWAATLWSLHCKVQGTNFDTHQATKKAQLNHISISCVVCVKPLPRLVRGIHCPHRDVTHMFGPKLGQPYTCNRSHMLGRSFPHGVRT